MQFWNHIIQVASLGTGKQQADVAEAEESLQPALQRINDNNQIDHEERFLQIVALAFNYRQSGASLVPDEKTSIEIASPEEKTYCPSAALYLLSEIIDAESNGLLEIWLNVCAGKGFIVPPELIPSLFDIASQNKKLQTIIAKCCGKRGEWLISFNPDWKFSTSESDEEIWNTGLAEQRRLVLMEMRTTDPAKARQLLEETWDKEDANTKALFLSVFGNGISEKDIDFLDKLKTEKSKKVKELAFALLKIIPASSVVREYVQILQQALQVKKEKALLGLVSKNVLQIQLPQISSSVFETGIEKLSNVKELSDDLFIVQQLMAYAPPSEIKSMLQLSYEEIADLFSHQSPSLLTAFGTAAVRFKDLDCFRVVVGKDKNTFYTDALHLLPPADAGDYGFSFYNSRTGTEAVSERNNLINAITAAKVPLDEAFSVAVVEHLAGNMYIHNRKFFSTYIHLFHPAMINAVDKFQPKEQYLQSQWANMGDYIKHLMQLRLQIQSSFIHKP
ncbi:DUF5691 domain-containing protein [Pinibacter soli]|uniref:DUF5691 domain-containing protein n=1 Tax=Pinibacter soli TaxID=3044211 RepID=A0ABT6RF41_9BACT|nr:DUF5691 domain-containing protein [Pinibacter soli]MDI3321036.1 DUF5691 domain-containing protein [Pinibacter soli]